MHLSYLGKEHGIAKSLLTITGLIAMVFGSYGYFSSSWIKNNIHEACDQLLNTQNGTLSSSRMELSCPGAFFEKYFVLAIIFCSSLSLLNLIGHLFSKQLSKGAYKLQDIVYHVVSGVMIFVAGSVFIYSSVKIEAVFNTVKDSVSRCNSTDNYGAIINQESFQPYSLKITAGAMTLLNGILYFVVAGLLFIT